MHAVVGPQLASNFIIPRPSFSRAIIAHLHGARFRALHDCVGSGKTSAMRMFLREPVHICGKMQMPVACRVDLGGVKCAHTAAAALRESMLFSQRTFGAPPVDTTLTNRINYACISLCHLAIRSLLIEAGILRATTVLRFHSMLVFDS